MCAILFCFYKYVVSLWCHSVSFVYLLYFYYTLPVEVSICDGKPMNSMLGGIGIHMTLTRTTFQYFIIGYRIHSASGELFIIIIYRISISYICLYTRICMYEHIYIVPLICHFSETLSCTCSRSV